MDYYIVVNGQKQGPFDILGLIKKVKNGVITAETLVSTNPDGPFVSALEFNELKDIVGSAEVEKPAQAVVNEANISFKRLFSDAAELWSRKIIEYTMMVGIIVVVGIMFSMTIKKIQFVADYSYIADYLTSVIIGTGLCIFSYYVLITKRNQEIDKKDVSAITKDVLPSILGFTLVLSAASVVFGINSFAGLLTIIVSSLVLSFVVFVPFLVTDHRLKLGRALMLSVNGFKSAGTEGAVAIFAVITANVVAAALPALLNNDAAFIGIVITLPLSTCVLAYIYDQVLA